MNLKTLRLIFIFCLMAGMWSCQDLPPTSGPGSPGSQSKKARIVGVVHDITTLNPVYNATVYRSSITGVADSTRTDANGNFLFEFDLLDQDSAFATITLKKHGYFTNSYSFYVHANLLISLNLTMSIDLSTSAVLSGVVRDSVTLYPLRATNVIFSVPGFSDNVVTSTDGAFTFTIDLIDRDSLPVTINASKTGFKTKQFTIWAHKGQSSDLGNILLHVDLGTTTGLVEGRVYDNQTRQPLFNTTVLLTSPLITDSLVTTGDGNYSFSIDLNGQQSLAGGLKFEKNGYRSQTISFNVAAGGITINDVYLNRDTGTGVRHDSGTGSAHSIALVSLSTNQISVIAVGGTESAIIVWEVRDSLGFPIDIDHRDTVTFELVGTPVAGGAYVSPASALTNASGRVATTINGGTVSGDLQFIATLRRDEDGQIIQSTPILITVNAGLPDQAHFTIGVAHFNFPGYDWVGHINTFTVLVGDRWTNPVRENTAVYFNTTVGVVDASGFTDPNGFTHAGNHSGDVTLYSGNPRPDDPVYGAGYLRVHAFTHGLNQVVVSDSILVLSSGRSQISQPVPNTFAVPAGGSSGPISFTVSDENGNPLAEGTHVTVTLQYTPPPNSNINLTVNGNVDVTLGDGYFGGPVITQFSFRVVDQTIGGVPSQVPVTVIIHVTSPNGNPGDVQISGTIG